MKLHNEQVKVALAEAKNMSALASCSNGLNVCMECGTTLEIRKKEKNERWNADLKI